MLLTHAQLQPSQPGPYWLVFKSKLLDVKCRSLDDLQAEALADVSFCAASANCRSRLSICRISFRPDKQAARFAESACRCPCLLAAAFAVFGRRRSQAAAVCAASRIRWGRRGSDGSPIDRGGVPVDNSNLEQLFKNAMRAAGGAHHLLKSDIRVRMIGKTQAGSWRAAMPCSKSAALSHRSSELESISFDPP